MRGHLALSFSTWTEIAHEFAELFVGVGVPVAGRRRRWSQSVRFSVAVWNSCPQPQSAPVEHRSCAACHHCSLLHLRVRHCIHLVGCQITPRTSCFHVPTTSPGLPDSDRPKKRVCLMSFFHRTHVCKFLTIFTGLEPTATGGELQIACKDTGVNTGGTCPQHLFFCSADQGVQHVGKFLCECSPMCLSGNRP